MSNRAPAAYKRLPFVTAPARRCSATTCPGALCRGWRPTCWSCGRISPNQRVISGTAGTTMTVSKLTKWQLRDTRTKWAVRYGLPPLRVSAGQGAGPHGMARASESGARSAARRFRNGNARRP